MCMKYVNTTVQCFNNSVSQYWFGNGGLSSFIQDVKCSKESETKYSVRKFGIVVFVNIRGSANDKMNNPLEQKEELEFKIRLTHLSSDSHKRLSYDLTSFSVNLADDSLIQTACFDYVDLIKVINVSDLEVESTGKYVLKVLIKKKNEQFYDIQMTHPLSITEARKDRVIYIRRMETSDGSNSLVK